MQPAVQAQLDWAAAAGAARMKLAVQRSLAARHLATARKLEFTSQQQHKEDRRLRLAFSEAGRERLGMLACPLAKQMQALANTQGPLCRGFNLASLCDFFNVQSLTLPTMAQGKFTPRSSAPISESKR